MPTYNVINIGGSVPKQYNGKPMQEVTFTLSDGAMSESCTWFTNAATAIPTVGSTIDGEIDRSNPQYPPKFKKAFAGGANGGANRANGMSPEREKKIVRQHSQAQAIAFLAATQKDGFGLQDVKKVTDWFDKDVFGAEAPAQPPEPAQPVQPVQPVQTLDDILVGVGADSEDIPF